MTAVVGAAREVRARRRRTGVIGSLALVESARMLRNPILWVGTGLTCWVIWSAVPDPDEWVGATYEETAVSIVPFLLVVSVVVAVSFHRERTLVAGGAPTGEARRSVARLVATGPLVLLAMAIAALTAWRQRDVGGLTLGVEPGRTADALYTLGELAQPVGLTVVAIAIGAALGRRAGHLVSALPSLFVLWLATSLYWLFADRRVTPLSIVQVQPIDLPAGPATADPMSFPSAWLLQAPNEFSDQWTRMLVSGALAWWHLVWLCGLALLCLTVAFPRGAARGPLLVGGTVLAVAGVGAQYLVLR